MDQPLLSVRNLVTRFRTARGTLTAVDHVSFDVNAGETWSTAVSVPRAVRNRVTRLRTLDRKSVV